MENQKSLLDSILDEDDTDEEESTLSNKILLPMERYNLEQLLSSDMLDNDDEEEEIKDNNVIINNNKNNLVIKSSSITKPISIEESSFINNSISDIKNRSNTNSLKLSSVKNSMEITSNSYDIKKSESIKSAIKPFSSKVLNNDSIKDSNILKLIDQDDKDDETEIFDRNDIDMILNEQKSLESDDESINNNHNTNNLSYEKLTSGSDPRKNERRSSNLMTIEALELKNSNVGNYSMTTPLLQHRINSLSSTSGADVTKLIWMDSISDYLKTHASTTIGIPNSFLIHSKVIAVGTSRGYIVIFDHFQKFITVLAAANTLSFGAVSALDITAEGDFIISGYANGFMILWNILTKEVLKVVEEIHDCKITNIKFIKKNNGKSSFNFISCDAKGTVNLVNIHNVIFSAYSVDHQCLFDSKTGPIFALNYYFPNPIASHPTDSFALLSICNQKLGLIVAMEPSPKVLFKIKRPDIASAIGLSPCCCWRAPIPSDEVKVKYDELDREFRFRSGPVFFLGWGNSLQIYLLNLRTESTKSADYTAIFNNLNVECSLFLSVNFDFEIISIEVLGSIYTSILSSKFQLHLFDPLRFDGKSKLPPIPICTVDLTSIQLLRREISSVAHQSDENAASKNSVNVSLFAWDCSSSTTVGSTLLSGSGSDVSLWFMGLQKVVNLKVLSWSERLNQLSEKGEWISALNLAIDFYDGNSIKFLSSIDVGLQSRPKTYAIGLPRYNISATRLIIQSKIAELLIKYVELASKPLRDSSNKRDIVLKSTENKVLHIIGGISIEYCICIDRIDILFNSIYNFFKQIPGAEEVLLTLIEPFILNDRISFLSPDLIGSFFKYYLSQQKLTEVEQCILHMDVKLLDYNQVVQLCREHKLFSALIYVCNKGKQEYGSPLEDMLNSFVAPNSSYSICEREKAGLKLLLYIKYSLTGRLFPRGSPDPDPENLKFAQTQILSILFPIDTKCSFKWLQFFLVLDCKETFNIISNVLNDSKCNFSKQHIVDALTYLYNAIDTVDSPNDFQFGNKRLTEFESYFSPMVSKFLSEGVIDAPPTLLLLILKYLVSGDMSLNIPLFKFGDFNPENIKSERQAILLNILRRKEITSGVSTLLTDESKAGLFLNRLSIEQRLNLQFSYLTCISWDFNFLLKNVLNSGFYKVALYLCNRSFDYGKAFDCYLNDDELKPFVFDYLTNLFRLAISDKKKAGDFESSQVQKVFALKKIALSRLIDLVNINSNSCAKLVVEFFSEDYAAVLKCLESHPILQYKFLRSIMIRHTDNSTPNTNDLIQDLAKPSSIVLSSVEIPTTLTGFSMNELLAKSNIKLTPEMHELYVRLLCQYAPESVHSHVTLYHDYKIEKILEICLEFKCQDAAAELMERSGAPMRALEIILSDVDEKVLILKNYCKNNPLNIPLQNTIKRRASAQVPNVPETRILDRYIHSASSLCQRITKSASDKESEAPWFMLLDKFILLYRENKSYNIRKEMSALAADLFELCLLRCVETILSTMGTFIALPSIFKKITDDHSHDEFREFRDTIQGMLDTYSYEENILFCAKKLISNDLFRSITVLHSKQSKALMKVDNNLCCLCNRKLTDEMLTFAARAKGTRVAVFACNHSYHEICLGMDKTCCPSCTKETKKNNKDRKQTIDTDIPEDFMNSINLKNDDENNIGMKISIRRLENAAASITKLPSAYQILNNFDSLNFNSCSRNLDRNVYSKKKVSSRKPGTLPDAPLIRHNYDDMF